MRKNPFHFKINLGSSQFHRCLVYFQQLVSLFLEAHHYWKNFIEPDQQRARFSEHNFTSSVRNDFQARRFIESPEKAEMGKLLTIPAPDLQMDLKPT